MFTRLMLVLSLVMSASLNAQDVATPVQQVQTVSQAACGTYNFHYYNSRAGMWSDFHCWDVYVDESGFFPVVRYQLLENAEWYQITILWGDDYDIIDNGDGLKSGHAGLIVDNPQPYVPVYENGEMVEIIPVHHAFKHYDSNGDFDGYIIQIYPGDPWQVVLPGYLLWFKE